MSQAAERIVKNSGYLFIKMGITVFITFFTTRLIMQYLGASDFGIFNVVGGSIGMLLFLNVAMAQASQRFLNYEEGRGEKDAQLSVFNISVVFHLGVALIIAIALVVAGFFLFDGILTIPPGREKAAVIVYASLIVSTVFTVMTVPYDAVMNAHENMLYYSIIGVVESLLKLGVALLVTVWGGDRLILYGILMAVIPLLTLTIMRIYCKRHYSECRFRPRRYWDGKKCREMVSFAGWHFLGSFSSVVGNNAMGIVLNHYFGTLLNAAYGVASQLTGQLMAFSNSMLKAVNPVIVKREAVGEREDMLHFSYMGCKYSYLLFCIFSIPFIIEAPFVLNVWLTEVPAWAVAFVRLQFIRTLLEQMTISMHTALAARGLIKQYNLASAFFFLLPIPILCLLFSNGASPWWYYIVNIALMVVVEGLVKLYFCHRLCGLRYGSFIKEVFFPVTVVTGTMFVAGYIPFILGMGEGWLRAVAVLSLTLISFVLACKAVLSGSEKALFKGFIRKFIKKRAD